MLDIPVRLALFVAKLLAAHRRQIGARRATRALGYADDIVAHCDSENQARVLRAAIADPPA